MELVRVLRKAHRNGRYENPEICTQEINSIPVANVAPVTRCKDCANSYEDAFGRVCTYGICVDCTVPDDFYCASSKPKEGALVVLSYPTGLGGSAYLTARCCGGVSDQYPFISTDAGISVQDIVECKCDSWLLISERQRGKQ